MNSAKILSLLLLLCMLSAEVIRSQVHTSYLWHLHQPVYWPEQSQWSPPKYQTARESHYLKTHGGNIYSDGKAHPLNDLYEIFSKDDRKAVYQFRAKDAVQSLLNLPEAGAQVNYSGALIENVNSLADAGQWGYNPGWQNNFITARNWQTNGGNPRMDIVGFTYHHLTSPLVSENMLRKDLQAYKYIYQQTFGTQPNYSKGYWPAECSFSERIIRVLAEEGYEWSVIANSHLARTLADYPLSFGTAGCNMDPPNRADKVTTHGTNWWSGQIDGRGGTFAAPYCYQAHKAQYVDPATGQVYKITVVPMDDVLSYKNGYALMGTSEIDQYIAPFEDPAHPGMVLLAHDGDNAWGGGYDYYTHSVPGFAQACASKGYVPSTIQQFLDDHPVPESDLVHVEDGSWVNAANDWGHPQFINWLWPMYTTDFEFNPEGWTEDARNWAVIVAAENRVQMAEDLTGTLNIADMVAPAATSPLAAKAWHYLLPGCASDFMYYGTALDMEVKQTLAANLATGFADQVIEAHPGTDFTKPTVFIPQRYPYNPGGIGFGPNYNYQQHQNPSNFFVWTFAYDVSGIQDIVLKYRLDNDGINPVETFENDIYNCTPGVSDWISLPMTYRAFPTGNVTNNPDIDFFILPDYIAGEYYAEITGLSEKLVDYFVEAVDIKGNLTRTPIQHVYVGQENSGGGGSASVSWFPEEPGNNELITIIVENATQGAKLHWGVNGFNTPNTAYWPAGTQLYNGSGPTVETPFTGPNSQNQLIIQVGPFNHPAQSVMSLDFVIHYNDGTWDNNNGADYHISFGAGGNAIVQWQPASPKQNEVITITVNQATVGGKLHWGVNNWSSPNPVYWPQGSFLFNGTGPAVQSPMDGPNTNNQLTIQIGPFNKPEQTVTKVDFVISFNNGSWNNNNGQDYHFNISLAAAMAELGGQVTALPLGELLPGATITVTNGTLIYTAVSSGLITPQTNYAISGIVPGLYTVTCEAAGFHSVQLNNVIILNTGEINMLDFKMEPLSYPPPSGWNPVITPVTHVVAIPKEVYPTINGVPAHQGDYFGVFYTDNYQTEKCGGMIEWINENVSLVAYGDDITTPEKEGFNPGEPLVWKIFSQQDQQAYSATPYYNPELPDHDGLFHIMGLSGLISLEGYEIVNQIITLKSGWSGISSYVDPLTPALEEVFAPLGDNFIILSNTGGMYYPATGTNTLGGWEVESGYQIKVSQDIEMILEGIPAGNRALTLNAGWNLIPVLTHCGGLTAEILGGLEDLLILKDVAGTKIYWPQQGITTLNYIEPGKAYWIHLTNSSTVEYPECISTTYYPPPPDIPVNHTPWNNVGCTPSSHVVAIPSLVLSQSGVKPGDILGAFTPDGFCVGMAKINHPGNSLSLTLFGNDVQTSEKDGLDDNEPFTMKLYRPETNSEILVIAEYDPEQPHQGLFAANGLSVLKTLEAGSNHLSENSGQEYQLWPNPAHESIFLFQPKGIEFRQVDLVNIQGKNLKTFVPETGASDSILEMDVSGLPQGIYFLKISALTTMVTKKMIIQ